MKGFPEPVSLMPSQSISQPCCLCGWQMTELDLSVIRWGGGDPDSVSVWILDTCSLLLLCQSCTLSLGLWCLSACEVYLILTYFPHLLFYHQSMSSFQDFLLFFCISSCWDSVQSCFLLWFSDLQYFKCTCVAQWVSQVVFIKIWSSPAAAD